MTTRNDVVTRACAGCGGTRRCWACAGRGEVRSDSGELAACSACEGRTVCRVCEESAEHERHAT